MAVVPQEGAAHEDGRVRALAAADPSTRLRAAMAAGTDPRPDEVEALVARCAVEPEPFVREALTWALTRHGAATAERLLAELVSPFPQARSQALHTLSKLGLSELGLSEFGPAGLGPGRAGAVVTDALLDDAEDEVARTAWRAAVALVGAGTEQRAALAQRLVRRLGRGDRGLRLSLSRALVGLGEPAVAAVAAATAHPDPRVRAHAAATQRLRTHPDEGLALAVEHADRAAVLRGTPSPAASPEPDAEPDPEPEPDPGSS